MTNCRSKLLVGTNLWLMHLLRDNPRVFQRQMRKALGLIFEDFNFCMNAMVEKGLFKTHNFSQNQKKFGYDYLLMLTGISEKPLLTCSFSNRKLQEFEVLKAEINALKSVIETENDQKPSDK